MDIRAFFNLSYGLYIISSKLNEEQSGCIVNTFQQVTSDPIQVAVTVNKDNYTGQLMEKSGYFHCVVLDQSTPMDVIKRFGFQSGKNIDKFNGIETSFNETGMPYIKEHMTAGFACKIIKQTDVGSHITFVAEIVDAEVYSGEPVMTYEYYHKVKNGATPKNASSYQEEKRNGWRCSVCGYIYEGDVFAARLCMSIM